MEWIDFSDLKVNVDKSPWPFRSKPEHLSQEETAACSDTLLLTMKSDALKEGEVKAVKDQINLSGYNPLRGANNKELGVRFPDMSHPYEIPAGMADIDVILVRAGQREDHPLNVPEAEAIVYQTILAKHQCKTVYALIYGSGVDAETLINIFHGE